MQDTERIMDEVVERLEKGTVRRFEFISEYDDLNPEEFLPRRSTEDSAGYDFICIKEQTIAPKSFGTIMTGIKVQMPRGEYLQLCNRSSNPKKRGLILANGVGVIDADYYDNPENEGNIGFMFFNMRDEEVTLHVGDKIGQGIFQEYKKTNPDNVEHKTRSGGFGSTGA